MANQEKKLLELKALVEGAEISLQQARNILATLLGDESGSVALDAKKKGSVRQTDEGQVIEGLFDGQNMLGPDGKKYSVPANYASKSKLVEGDGLKLTITGDGSFVYKQINLLERNRLTGDLVVDEDTDEFRVLAGGKSYKVLTASITYFKGEPGDKVTILVPKDRETSWAAVENIFKPGEDVLPTEDKLARQVDESVSPNERPRATEPNKDDGSDQHKDEEPSDNFTPDEMMPEEDEPIKEDHETSFLTPEIEEEEAKSLAVDEAKPQKEESSLPPESITPTPLAASDSKNIGNEVEDIFASTDATKQSRPPTPAAGGPTDDFHVKLPPARIPSREDMPAAAAASSVPKSDVDLPPPPPAKKPFPPSFTDNQGLEEI